MSETNKYVNPLYSKDIVSVGEIIGNRLALTAPDYTRLYLGMEEVEKITDANVLLRLGNVECL